jgi:hypothetical protein
MRALAVATAVVVSLILGAVAYGRAEGRHAVAAQQRGILGVRAAVGQRLLHPDQAIYDPGGQLECLTYQGDGRNAVLELCFDPAGRLLEAVDRRRAESIWSLRWDPAAAPLRLDPPTVETTVKRLSPDMRLVGLLP